MSRGGGRGREPVGGGEGEWRRDMQPALTPLASYGSGLSPQGLLPSAHPTPTLARTKVPLGAMEGSQSLPRGKLTSGVRTW